jgi:hypothetical protein
MQWRINSGWAEQVAGAIPRIGPRRRVAQEAQGFPLLATLSPSMHCRAAAPLLVMCIYRDAGLHGYQPEHDYYRSHEPERNRGAQVSAWFWNVHFFSYSKQHRLRSRHHYKSRPNIEHRSQFYDYRECDSNAHFCGRREDLRGAHPLGKHF